MSENTAFQEILQTNREVTPIEAREKTGNRVWGRYNLGENEYSATFGIVSDESIGEILADRKQAGKTNLVCDLMAGTGFLESIADTIDGGVAVGLGDGRNILEQEDDAEKGIDMVEGNIISKRTWRDLHTALEVKKSQLNGQTAHNNRTQEVDGFTLITCRPLGGIYYLTKDINVHFWLLQNAYTMLSKDNGVLLTQLPYPSDGDIPKGVEIVKEWIAELHEENPALAIAFGQSENGRSFALKMVKTPECPEELPPLQRLVQQRAITEELRMLEPIQK